MLSRSGTEGRDMLKTAGAILVIGGAAILGSYAVYGLNLRVRVLLQWMEALNTIRSEIRFALVPIPELMQLLGNRSGGEVGDFFAECASQLENMDGVTFSEIWSNSLKKTLGGILKNEEKLALGALGDVLGRYDAEEQVNGIEHALSRLEYFYTTAEQERSRLGRVYGAMGVLSGIAVVIILI